MTILQIIFHQVLRKNLHLVDENHSVPVVRTSVFGLNSIKYKSVAFWNYLNRLFYMCKLFDKKRNLCKGFIKNYFIEGYI